MLRILILPVIFFVLSLPGFAQEQKAIVVYGTIVDGDTIPVIPLREVNIYSWKLLDAKQARKMTKLMKNVKIVYPYARLAGIKLDEYEEVLMQAADDRERRRIMKQAEDESEAEYGQELRDLTISQGKILIKLIDRETGESSYDLVSDLRGEFRAVFYQAFARIFGYNLKIKYDPEGEDKDIEMIVLMIESGQL
jgi:ribosomal protein L14E/L6E/L27E